MKQNVRHVGIVALFMVVLLWVILAKTSLRTQSYDLLPDAIKELEVPDVHLEYQKPLYNESKVALLIENRPDGKVAPLLLHMMSVVPPDWRFRFMGSESSVDFVNRSAAIRRQVEIGKLDLTYIPSNVSVAGQEPINRLFTNIWFYETLLQPAEWLLVFQTDSILCSKSLDSLDNWLQYDWVGASWGRDWRWSGNGGLSLRKVSSIIKILQHQQRLDNSDPEDLWLSERLAHLPGARVANGTEAMPFSVEEYWYEYPLGYHTGGGGKILPSGAWGTPEHRKLIYEYCPEMKMLLDMDIEFMMPEICTTEW